MATGTKTDRNKKIVNLFHRGVPDKRIGEIVGCSESVVGKVLKALLLEPALRSVPQPGKAFEPRRVPVYTCPGCDRKIKVAPCVACASGVK